MRPAACSPADGDDGPRAASTSRPYGARRRTTWWVVSDLGTGLDGVRRPPSARPRARRRRRLDDAGPAHAVRRRSGAPSTSAPAAACRRCTWPAHATTVVGHRHQPARARGSAGLTAGAVRRRARPARTATCFEPVAGERFDLVVVQPAVRHRRRAGRVHLPRRRPAAATTLCRAARPARPPATSTPAAAGASCSPTGSTCAARTGASGSPAGCRPTACDALGRAARGARTRRSTSRPWLRDAGERRHPAYAAAVRRLARTASRRAASTAVGFGWVDAARRRRHDRRRRVASRTWPPPGRAAARPARRGVARPAGVAASGTTDDDALAAATAAARAATSSRSRSARPAGRRPRAARPAPAGRRLRRAGRVDTATGGAGRRRCDGDAAGRSSLVAAVAGLAEADGAGRPSPRAYGLADRGTSLPRRSGVPPRRACSAAIGVRQRLAPTSRRAPARPSRASPRPTVRRRTRQRTSERGRQCRRRRRRRAPARHRRVARQGARRSPATSAPGYDVEASVGHIRDLPDRQPSCPADDEEGPLRQVRGRRRQRLRAALRRRRRQEEEGRRAQAAAQGRRRALPRHR